LLLFVLAILFIAAWWFTKKVGSVVYSMSGESELFTIVSGSQLTEVVGFLNKLQAAVEAANASRKLSDVN
jgi:cell division protein YceG involved in septum cleavage